MPVDLSASMYAEYQRARKRAEAAERRGQMGEAAAAYHQAAEMMRRYAQYTHDASVRKQRLDRAAALDQAAEQLEQGKRKVARPAAGGAPPTQPDVAAGEDDYEAEVTALIEKTSVRWEDIGGLEDTKQTIKLAYGMALARKPDGYKVRPARNLLLFGPPGTGKTLLAAATAGNLDATFFNVKVSNMLSKYFGESTKLVSALFTVARRMSPAVVFMDEFEALTPPRGSGESGAERRIVSTLLAELDGLSSKDDESFVLTLGATNLPWLLDSAILSRFQKRIYVPLPDEPARRAILNIHLEKRGFHSKVTLNDLVRRSEGYAGREIEQICQAAIEHMTQTYNEAKISKKVDEGQEATRGYLLDFRPLSEEDFTFAFTGRHPLASPDMLRHYDDWLKKVDS